MLENGSLPLPRAQAIRRLRLALLSALLLGSLASCYSAEYSEPVALEITFDAPPGETFESDLLGGTDKTLYERLEQLREVADSDHYRGLLVRVSSFGGGFARSRELARALTRIRQAGKPVHCYFEQTDNAGYALLSGGCERISMPPPGLLNLVGVRAQAYYARDFLDRVGVKAEMMHVGRFKGAADTLTRNSMPEHTRLTLTHLGEHLQSGVATMIESGRKLSAKAVEAAIHEGPLTAAAARRHRLVDDIGYQDEAREHLRRAAKVDRVEIDQAPGETVDFSAILDELTEAPSMSAGRHLVLVPLVGTIGVGSSLNSGVDSASFVQQMRRLRDDPDVAAVVIRVDSPGGSALASDVMWHAVTELAKQKPVIASVGDMAASGGYYIACAAQKIYAEPTSVIGSIGVVGGKIQFSELVKRLGINVETLRAAPNAGWSSPTSPFSDSERTAVRNMLESTYNLFLKRVSAGRDIPVTDLAALAEGRVMHAQSAIDSHLVDELGGLLDALDAARRTADLPRDAKVLVWPERHSALSALLGLSHAATQYSGANAKIANLKSLPSLLLQQTDVPLLQVLAAEQNIAATLPFGLQIR